MPVLTVESRCKSRPVKLKCCTSNPVIARQSTRRDRAKLSG